MAKKFLVLVPIAQPPDLDRGRRLVVRGEAVGRKLPVLVDVNLKIVKHNLRQCLKSFINFEPFGKWL